MSIRYEMHLFWNRMASAEMTHDKYLIFICYLPWAVFHGNSICYSTYNIIRRKRWDTCFVLTLMHLLASAMACHSWWYSTALRSNQLDIRNQKTSANFIHSFLPIRVLTFLTRTKLWSMLYIKKSSLWNDQTQSCQRHCTFSSWFHRTIYS